MGKYVMCPTCGNVENHATIYRCNECKYVFCSSCSSKGLWQDKCPKCKTAEGLILGLGWETLGRIETK